MLILVKSSVAMNKRPKIRGRGADIYLGGESEQRADLRRKKFADAPVAEKVQAEDKIESRSDRGQPSYALESLKRIRNSERLANQAIELQEQNAQWAKNTPLAP